MNSVLAAIVVAMLFSLPWPVSAQGRIPVRRGFVPENPTGTIPPLRGPWPTGTIPWTPSPPPIGLPRIGLPLPSLGLPPPRSVPMGRFGFAPDANRFGFALGVGHLRREPFIRQRVFGNTFGSIAYWPNVVYLDPSDSYNPYTGQQPTTTQTMEPYPEVGPLAEEPPSGNL